jgi:murein DD-endopeptidase MepM/ murein hydrolase activator NlpD
MTEAKETRVALAVEARGIYTFLVILGFLFNPGQFSGISQNDDLEAKIHKDRISNRDSLICHEFYSPFIESDRQSFLMIKKRVVGVYGEYRRSYKPGHHHAGLDLWGAFNESVYAIGYGWVVRVFRGFPHRSVIVEHHLPDGSILYSAYVHIEDIQVKVGDWVDESTPLGRVFSKNELQRANFNTPNHLHLEIRKSLADEGSVSYASMSMRVLNKVCLDPLKFFKNTMTDSKIISMRAKHDQRY